MRRALIIGNGPSRLDFNLETIKGKLTTFGCNAIYRDFEPDWLVAIDQGIIAEIKNSDFPKEKFINVPWEEQFEPAEANPGRPRSNAGMNAMLEAIKRDYYTLYCIGFDFLIDDETATNNIYADTNAYGDETRVSLQDSRNRMNFLRWFVRSNYMCKFNFCFPSLDNKFMELDRPNFKLMTFDNLIGEING